MPLFLLNMRVTFDISEIEETLPQQLRSNLRQSWRQPVVVLVMFAVGPHQALVNYASIILGII